jgi:hypothetical protein
MRRMSMGADSQTPLPGLPGASLDPGQGAVVPALLEGMLTDGGQDPAAHRAHREAWYAELVGPLAVRADAVERLQEALDPRDHALRVLLVAAPDPDHAAAEGDAGLEGLREARNRLLDDDRVELAGVQLAVPLPAPAGTAAVTRALLAALDFSVPAWIEVPLLPGWEQALDVVVEDGAEHVAVDAGNDPGVLAAFVRRAVDLDVTFRLTGLPAAGGPPAGIGVLAAVRAALNGAETPEVTRILAERRPAPLASALRRMSDADAAVARAFLAAGTVADVRGTVDELVALGLVDPQE